MVNQPPQGDCKERVALDLMQAIAADELERPEGKAERDGNPRRYWLKLYEECLATVKGARGETRPE